MMGSPAPAVSQQTRPEPQFEVYFEYTGDTGLTVQGPVSGKRYRFDGPGAQVAVDLRDRLSLLSVPKLRQVMR